MPLSHDWLWLWMWRSLAFRTPDYTRSAATETSWMHANGRFHYLVADLPIYRLRARCGVDCGSECGRCSRPLTFLLYTLKCINRRIRFPFFSTPSNRIKESGEWEAFFSPSPHTYVPGMVAAAARVPVHRRNDRCKRFNTWIEGEKFSNINYLLFAYGSEFIWLIWSIPHTKWTTLASCSSYKVAIVTAETATYWANWWQPSKHTIWMDSLFEFVVWRNGWEAVAAAAS